MLCISFMLLLPLASAANQSNYIWSNLVPRPGKEVVFGEGDNWETS